MGRPDTLEQFIEICDEIESAKPKKEVPCKACETPYNCALTQVTEGYCRDCAQEVFYDDISGSVEGVIEMNDDAAEKHNKSHKAHTEAQRYGKGKTGG